jgi:hypothetical protein
MSAAPKKPRAKKAAPVTLEAIKGFNRDMTCRGFQFEVGKSFKQDGKVKACKSGFHACPTDLDPLTVFQFYAPGVSRYCIVDMGGKIDRSEADKAASSEVFVRSEISVAELIERAVKFRLAKAKPTGAASNSGTRGAASNSGDYGAASNSGYGGAASNSGDYGAASNSGDYGAAMSHAHYGKVMCEGDGQALYCTEFSNDGSIKSVACGITGREGIVAGTWYVCRDGRLVAA